MKYFSFFPPRVSNSQKIFRSPISSGVVPHTQLCLLCLISHLCIFSPLCLGDFDFCGSLSNHDSWQQHCTCRVLLKSDTGIAPNHFPISSSVTLPFVLTLTIFGTQFTCSVEVLFPCWRMSDIDDVKCKSYDTARFRTCFLCHVMLVCNSEKCIYTY